MSHKTAVIILNQTDLSQNFQLHTPMNQAIGLTVENISLIGYESDGTTLVLSSPSFAGHHADQVSQYNVNNKLFPLPIGWIQPNPMPPRNLQLNPISLRFDNPRDFNSLFINFSSNGNMVLDGFQAEWLLTFYLP